MITTDPLINIANWSMNLEKLKASQWAESIANASVSNSYRTVNFDDLLREVASSYENGNAKQVHSQINDTRSLDAYSSIESGKVNLDEAVASMNQSAGRYKVIAESISRKIGLMAIVTKGK